MAKGKIVKKLVILLLVLVITGCAAKSGVVPIGPDTYMVSRQTVTGLGNMKAEAFQEADEYCNSQNKHIRVVNTIESPSAYIWGKFPKVEIQFMCLNKPDIEYKDQK
jgi:hypothetical protein